MTRRVRLAWVLFAAHVSLIVFSTLAMMTVLAGAPGFDVTGEPAATIMRLSFRFAGPAYVVIGALSALAFLGTTVGWRTASTLAMTATGLALSAELLGTLVGLPFGPYAYSGLLGYRILGLVPFPIPLSWFYMLIGSLAIVGALARRERSSRARWSWALGAGLLMVAWDVSMDPAMVATGHWAWGSDAIAGEAFTADWARRLFTGDAFYGMPLSNWFGWLITAALIARAMLAVTPPPDMQRALSASRLPIALYLVNGVMPIALCLREGFWLAATLGTAAMLVPGALAWTSRSHSPRELAGGGVA